MLVSLWTVSTYYVFYHTSDASSVNLESFQKLILAGRFLVTIPLVAPYIVPRSLGFEVHHHNTYHGSVAALFKVIAAGNFALFLLTTFNGLKHSAPDAYYHRHSIHLPFDVEKRSAWERTTSATGRILSATADHPVVQGATFDVVLSALSLGIWAAVRSISVQNMLACAVPGALREGDSGKWSWFGKSPVTGETKKNSQRKRLRSGSKVQEEEDTSEESYEPSEADSVPEGDVIPESDLDWESTAVALGLMVVGGLGFGSAGVMGAECVPVG